jgi:hypothetical protein
MTAEKKDSQVGFPHDQMEHKHRHEMYKGADSIKCMDRLQIFCPSFRRCAQWQHLVSDENPQDARIPSPETNHSCELHAPPLPPPQALSTLKWQLQLPEFSSERPFRITLTYKTCMSFGLSLLRGLSHCC